MTDADRRAARTVLQTTVALAATLPAITAASGIPETLPWVAGALAIAGGLSRVMALPQLQRILPPWLRTTGLDDVEILARR